jgi:hypothetical protein
MSAQAALESQAVATTILMVEDKIFVRLDIAEVLRNASFRVIEAGNADEALAVLNSAYPIDALMTDIRMPGSNRWDQSRCQGPFRVAQYENHLSNKPFSQLVRPPLRSFYREAV